MGNSKSKYKSGKTNRKSRHSSHFGNVENSANPGEDYNDPELLSLRRTIENNPEIFILNNLMMCVQFFGNYEEEIKHVKETLVSSREAELSKHLPRQKHVLLPDVLQEHIARKVGFTSTRQTMRPTIELLQPVRIYTVHDNINITENNFSSHYSNVNDSMVYNILLAPTEHQGYVQLQILDDFAPSKKTKNEDDVDLSSITEDEDKLYSDRDSIYGPKPRSNLSALVTSNRSKQGIRKNSKSKQTRSMPNLCDQGITSTNQEIWQRVDRNVKVAVDHDNGCWSEEQRRKNSNKISIQQKGELSSKEKNQRSEKQVTRLKNQGANNQDHTSSNSSGYRSDNYAMDSDSSSNPTGNSRISQSSSLNEIDESWLTNGEFPNRCFKKVTYTADGRIYNAREDKMHLLNSKQRRIKLALRRHNYDLYYMSSTEFMKHFIKLFVYRLGSCLGFDRESVEDVRREGCVLYCDKIMISNTFKHSRVEQYEIIPAVWLEWPVCAQEWLDRPRSTWPDCNDVEKMKDFGCYVVPEGFVPKNGNSNLIEDLEWQLTFPTAERYLETCMTQAQVQVYLIALMLHKTFMRPIFDTMFGLTAAHIKHKLFWMIEEDDRLSKWPDNGIGECLLKLLYSLYYSISQNEPTLRDYFIKDRNLFQRIPCEHLLHTQKQLKRITENPVMYVFHAMENIRYSDNFFPRIDFDMLLKILTVDTLALVNPTLNPNLRQPISKPIPRISEEYIVQRDKHDKTGFWDTVRNQRSKHSVQLITNKTIINPRKATDSIIEISTRCAGLEGPRLCVLLNFFIEHFIKMAERCNQYQAHRQKTVYLDHADRLSILLFEHQSYKEDARAYRDKIKVLRKKLTCSNPPLVRPQSSETDQEKAIYVARLNERFSQESRKRAQNVTKAIIYESHYEEPKSVSEPEWESESESELELDPEWESIPKPKPKPKPKPERQNFGVTAARIGNSSSDEDRLAGPIVNMKSEFIGNESTHI